LQKNTPTQDLEHKVTQVFCASYRMHSESDPVHFEPFVKLLLYAAYNATLAISAEISCTEERRVTVFLQYVGGFKGTVQREWAKDAIRRVLPKYEKYALDVRVLVPS
jgi:hypothetical protein